VHLLRTLCLALAAGLVAPGASAEWRRLDTPNFTVVGDAAARTLREIAVEFERFRETLGRVLGDGATASPVPTIVLVFPSDRAFAPLKPTFEGKVVELSGQFVGASDLNYIAIVAGGGVDAVRVVFHEYAHLVSSNLGRNVPAWLEEGLAEYYSTYEPARGGREAILGKPVESHLLRLRESRLLPLDELLGVTRDSALYNEGDRRSVFYAQSWALTHMLLAGGPSRRAQLSDYLARLSAGAGAVEAWQQVFGRLPVERELRRYVARDVFLAQKYKFTEQLATVDVDASPMSRADGEAFLADLLLQQNRLAEADQRLAIAASFGPPSVWMRSVAAGLDLKRGDAAAAQRKLSQIDQVSDWLTAYRAGAVLAEAGTSQDVGPAAPEIAAVRRLFDTARQRGRRFAQATARLAELELASPHGPSSDLTAAMEQARHAAPGREDYVFLHARLLAHDGAFAAAREALAPMLHDASPRDTRDYASSVMTYIAQLERAHGGDPHQSGASDVGRSGAPASGADYGAVVRGEQRIVGVMERIDCDGPTAIFNVRTADHTQTFTARDLPSVNFVTYRLDLGQTISCGPLKEPARVALTWRPGAKPGERVAVLVEFLAVKPPQR
jgi:hypothetical protein